MSGTGSFENNQKQTIENIGGQVDVNKVVSAEEAEMRDWMETFVLDEFRSSTTDEVFEVFRAHYIHDKKQGEC